MTDNKWPYRLLAPGPVPVPPQVLAAMSERVLHHRTPAFEKILRETWSGLQMVFATAQPVQILSGTGSAAMEAAIANVLSPGDEALVVVSGKFGERWAEMCERLGVRTHRLNVPWGEAVDLAQLETELKKYKTVRAVLCQACETSTATVHPIQKIAQLVRRSTSALFLVDAITAVGTMPLPMDEWELDVVVGGSQKAFMIPTGLSFVALSARAWDAYKNATIPKFYLDLGAEQKANSKGETFFSTPTSLIVGLDVVLRQMRLKKISSVQSRCRALAEGTREAAKALGLCVFSSGPSDSVSALALPLDVDSGLLRDWLEKERNITVMGGQDKLKGKILRVGHMGHIGDDDMRALVRALAEGLKRLESVQKAVDVLDNRLSPTETLFP
jgi:aspartate aminotransferase-like enzyme